MSDDVMMNRETLDRLAEAAHKVWMDGKLRPTGGCMGR